MLQWNPSFLFKEINPKRSCKLLLIFSLVASSIFWVGCSTLGQGATQSASQSSQSLSLPASLAKANVGSIYQAALSVNGGKAPYRFAVSLGTLPPGLVLNPITGNISGTPTQAGSFTFTISVTGDLSSGAGTHSYTLTVNSCTQCVAVQISPVDPSVAAGATIQFSATVSNTSNSAVIWSASAGTISSNGLFTAPSNSTAKTISVTASSQAQTGVQAVTTVTITTSALEVATSSVPSAVIATPYSTSLAANGGVPPYQWSIVSGSLPAGLKLTASTGTVSGSATLAGTFTFSVQAADADLQTARKSLSLQISPSGQICGPPAYACSRTDTDIVQLPGSPPNVGNLLGANNIVTDPDFGNPIVRITDANTNPSTVFKNRTYVSAASGSADENLWNVDSTLFVVQDSGSNTYPFTFNPNTLQAARMYVLSFPTTNGLKLAVGADWSRTNPNLLYSYSGTSISKYDFTNRTVPPSSQPVYDFTSSPNCLPAGFTVTWQDRGGVSGDDTVIGMTFSSSGNQGTGVIAVAYKVGSGCSVLNTQTGQVGGDWGTKGTINIPDRWTIHNAKLSKDGNWMVIVSTNCLSSICTLSPYFWQIGTTNVSSCGDGKNCGGHWTEGYTHWQNNDNSPISNQVIRAFSEPTITTNLSHVFPPGIDTNLDQHQSWNNADPADSLPFFSTTESTTSPYPAPWLDEIIGVAADGSGTTWRFAHNFITHNSQQFSTDHAIGSVSQDGKFFIFSSDWMGKLGSEQGTATCTIGTNCRGDVFVVELR
jgi:hypothetical protein